MAEYVFHPLLLCNGQMRDGCLIWKVVNGRFWWFSKVVFLTYLLSLQNTEGQVRVSYLHWVRKKIGGGGFISNAQPPYELGSLILAWVIHKGITSAIVPLKQTLFFLLICCEHGPCLRVIYIPTSFLPAVANHQMVSITIL